MNFNAVSCRFGLPGLPCRSAAKEEGVSGLFAVEDS